MVNPTKPPASALGARSTAKPTLPVEQAQAICGLSDAQVALVRLMGAEVFVLTNSSDPKHEPQVWLSTAGSHDGALVWGFEGRQHWECMGPGVIATSHDGALQCLAEAIAAVGTGAVALDKYLTDVADDIVDGIREAYE